MHGASFLEHAAKSFECHEIVHQDVEQVRILVIFMMQGTFNLLFS